VLAKNVRGSRSRSKRLRVRPIYMLVESVKAMDRNDLRGPLINYRFAKPVKHTGVYEMSITIASSGAPVINPLSGKESGGLKGSSQHEEHALGQLLGSSDLNENMATAKRDAKRRASAGPLGQSNDKRKSPVVQEAVLPQTRARANAITAGKPKEIILLPDLKTKAETFTGNFLGNGLLALMAFMNSMELLGNKLLSDMMQKSNMAKKAQEKANKLDRILSQFTNADDKLRFPVDVRDWMYANGVFVDGKDIETWMRDNNNNSGTTNDGKEFIFKKDAIQAVKSALDNFVGRQTDMSQQANLSIQKATTTYNFLVTGATQLTTLMGELNKSIWGAVGR
jgi:secreted effector protein SseB